MRHVRGHYPHVTGVQHLDLSSHLELQLALEHSAHLLLGVVVHRHLRMWVEVDVVEQCALPKHWPEAQAGTHLHLPGFVGAHDPGWGVGIGLGAVVRAEVAVSNVQCVLLARGSQASHGTG